MVDIIQVKTEEYNLVLRDLFTEYLKWVLLKCEEEFNVNYNIDELVKEAVGNSIEMIHNFFPPSGCLFLCKDENGFVGTACIRKIGDRLGEIKRMYIRPKYRGKGLGRILMNKLIEIAKDYKYSKLRLDSGPFMKAAQNLYKSSGFHGINPYPESEVLGDTVPKEISQNWIFMELCLE